MAPRLAGRRRVSIRFRLLLGVVFCVVFFGSEEAN